jgi:hypothetical protein
MDAIERTQLQARIAELLVLTREQLRQKDFRKAQEMAREASQLKQKLADAAIVKHRATPLPQLPD